MDIGLTVGGFVDAALFPVQSVDCPAEGTVGEFETWWADSRQPTADPAEAGRFSVSLNELRVVVGPDGPPASRS
ncbi:hypothetical protein OG806_48585 [Streptomyces sp. NBC_00882]|uniref:hypothetical protein n=1 Tax=Streptomyces sp. NBC_00882 TaxID=2975856 RepID=UPI003865EBE0|nr:hypothetical protein OG806_48585 [Streptomyces sp. NBC_00882]